MIAGGLGNVRRGHVEKSDCPVGARVVVLGGVVIGVTANLTGAYVSSAWKEVIPFVVMLAILIVRPHGLLARRHLKKV